MTTPTATVAQHLRYAVDALRLADDALGDLLDAMDRIPEPLIDSYSIFAYRETVRHFISVFAPAESSLGPRLQFASGLMIKIRQQIADADADARNLPGLERAGLALRFAAAALADAVDVYDEEPDGDEWFTSATAALTALEMVQGRIECCTLRRPADGCN